METDKPLPNAEAKISLWCLKTGVLITKKMIKRMIKLFSAQRYLTGTEGVCVVVVGDLFISFTKR